ncbi:MAG: single-stranded-DNA-specific exonuclease RecJ [Desulfobacterales bacterium]
MKKRLLLARPPETALRELEGGLGLSPLLARLLVNRGISSCEAARDFLAPPAAERLRPPSGLQDLEPALERLSRAVRAGEEILVFGDYDVDGVTAGVTLEGFLAACGARVRLYLPHRIEDGYGLKPRHIREEACRRGIRLVVTVDSGSSSHAAVREAAARGVDVIVTDHHAVNGELPPALAVINPRRPDCPAGLGHLSGVGVAFYLAVALRRRLREKGFFVGRPEPNLLAWSDLVALGTIADAAPLAAENRILTRIGLARIVRSARPGLEALKAASGLSAEDLASGEEAAFRLIPPLNAAGRLEHPRLAAELLTARTAPDAERLARRLTALNRARRELERTVLAEAEAEIASRPELLAGHSLVLARTGWHPGVIGIAAARLAERFSRPVVLVALDGRRGRGSARSLPGIDLAACLSACGRHLEAAGGHAQAAGLEIDAARLPSFRAAFEEAVAASAAGEARETAWVVDAPLEIADIDGSTLQSLRALMPFGAGNPEPLFLARGVEVIASTPLSGGHRRLLVRSAGAGARRPPLPALWFHPDPRTADCRRFARLVYRLRSERPDGRRPELRVEDADPG